MFIFTIFGRLSVLRTVIAAFMASLFLTLPNYSLADQARETTLTREFDKDEQDRDYLLIVDLLEDAIDEGEIEASLLLGMIYMNNPDIQNGQKALEAFTVGAVNAIPSAQYHLSFVYMGSPDRDLLDPLKAYVWLLLAEYNGYGNAAGLPEELARQMLSQEEQIAGQELARRCLESDYSDCP
jgi:TPR repeat protein